ncbi:MAG: sporulation protein YqfD [Oscillospiraceae bacterium]
MFILRLLRLLRGYIRFTASGGYFERFLNQISQQNISIWDMETSPEQITGMVFVGDYKTLARMAQKCGVRIRVSERFGLPFVFQKYRKRVGVLIGLGAFLILIIVMQNFVWTLDVEGNESNSTERVTYVLQQLGLRPGAFIPSLNIEEIENKAILELDNIAWFTINNYGSRVVVEMKESVQPPEILDETTPCNIVATKSGVVRRTEIYTGQSVVDVGSVVSKGDLLVSGVVDNASEEILFKHARAKIFAETYFDESFEVLKTETKKVDAGNAFDHHFLNLFGFKIPLFVAFPLEGEYRTTVTETPAHLFGLQLPFGLQTIHYEEYATETTAYNAEEAQARLYEIYESYKQTQLADIEILEETPEFTELEDRYVLKVSMVCFENIALEQKLFQ